MAKDMRVRQGSHRWVLYSSPDEEPFEEWNSQYVGSARTKKELKKLMEGHTLRSGHVFDVVHERAVRQALYGWVDEGEYEQFHRKIDQEDERPANGFDVEY